MLAASLPLLGSSELASLWPIWFRTRFFVVSLSNDDEQFIWELAAGGSFSVQKDTEMVHRGGQARHVVHLLLEEDQSEFLEERRLTDLVKKLSEFIGFPIEHVEKSKVKEVTDSEQEVEDSKKRRKVRLVMSPKLRSLTMRLKKRG